MSATPRTDSICYDRTGDSGQRVVSAVFARQLETELAEARQALTGRTVSCEACEQTARERDALKAALSEACACLDACASDLEDLGEHKQAELARDDAGEFRKVMEGKP